MGAEEIVPGVYRVLKGYVNAYAVVAEDGITLVDTGLPRALDRVVAGLREAGGPDGAVRNILITHHHSDHIGGLAALASRTGATVYAPAGDAAIIRGEARPPPANRAVLSGRLLGGLLARLSPAVEPGRIDVEVVDGQELAVAGGMRAIHTPGHTAGHTSYLLARDGGVLFAGDAAGASGSRVGPPVGQVFGMFTEDLDEARKSFRKLAELRFDAALVGHGKPVPAGARAAFLEGLGRLGS